MGVFWACYAFERMNVRKPCHMSDLNRYRREHRYGREASSLFIEIYRSVLLGHGIWDTFVPYMEVWDTFVPYMEVSLHPASDETRPHCSYPLIFPYFSSQSYYFARGDGNW